MGSKKADTLVWPNAEVKLCFQGLRSHPYHFSTNILKSGFISLIENNLLIPLSLLRSIPLLKIRSILLGQLARASKIHTFNSLVNPLLAG